jgi:uncharacterized protein with GYD domain
LADDSALATEAIMAFYLVQAALTQTGAGNLVQHPQRREDVLRKTCDALGGKLHHFFFCFGKYDVVLLAELPNNKAAAALSLSVEAAGAARMIHTTVLLTTADAVEAMKAAQTDKYTPPV